MVDGKVIFNYEVSEEAATSVDTGAILNGDNDGIYTIIARHVYDTADSTLNAYFNADNTAANYGYRGLTAANTTVANVNSTGALLRLCAVASGSTTGFSVLRVYAKQGSVRLLNGFNVCNINGTTVTRLEAIGSVWNNTNTAITNIVFAPSAGKMGVGTRIIILKGDAFPVTTPTGGAGAWKLIGTTVLGSAGASFSFDVSGDTGILYHLLFEGKASANVGGIRIKFNNDTGNSYGYQYLQGTTTTVNAGRATTGTTIYSGNMSAAAVRNCYASHLIFAKSGFIRPVISNIMWDIDTTTIGGIIIAGQSWNNTSDNITNITLYHIGGGTLFDAGSQCSLYALYP